MSLQNTTKGYNQFYSDTTKEYNQFCSDTTKDNNKLTNIFIKYDWISLFINYSLLNEAKLIAIVNIVYYNCFE